MVKQIQISLWMDGQNPAIDKPHEVGGVMQDTLEETIKFASEMIRSHWMGECICVIKPDQADDVYVRPECVFKYCPDPDTCKSDRNCQYKAG